MTPELNSNRKVVWVLGLNHSGTTIVWKSFRKNPKFLCFDEPLTAQLGRCFPNINPKRTFDEYIHMYGNNPAFFWKIFAPIQPLQELDSKFIFEQERYLRSLLDCEKNVLIDETHIHLHLPSLVNISPEANIIHLYRRASAFVTSHLRPNRPKKAALYRRVAHWLRYQYNKSVFWSRQDFLPGMNRGDVIGNHPRSKFGLILSDAGYDVERIMNSPALVRLLAYWHFHYHYLEREGPRIFGERFLSINYEDFANQPQETMKELYQWIGMERPDGVTYSDVHAPKLAYRVNDSRWRVAARIAGFSEEELDTLL